MTFPSFDPSVKVTLQIPMAPQLLSLSLTDLPKTAINIHRQSLMNAQGTPTTCNEFTINVHPQ